MGEQTKIQWCDHTFSSWIGCAKVSAGCAHCYAAVDSPARISRGHGLELWGADAARKGKAESGWKEPERWFRAAVKAGVRRRVFSASQSDVFEDRRDLDVHRERLWNLLEDTCGWVPALSTLERRPPPWEDLPSAGLDWLLLTKRPENIMRLIPERWRAGLPPNVCVGTSVENQEAADTRIPHLLRVPARVRFLSCEPLLGPVNLGLGGRLDCEPVDAIHWVIAGGESGPKARPCDIAWIRDLVAQCRAAGVAPLVKQVGARPIWSGGSGPGEHWPEGTKLIDIGGAWQAQLRDSHGGDMDEWPHDVRIREFPEVA